MSSFLWSFAASLRQEDEDKDEAKETHAAVEEEGRSVPERLLQVSEGLRHDEPTEVGDQVGQGVRPTAGPGHQCLHLKGNLPWGEIFHRMSLRSLIFHLMGRTSVATTHVRLPRPRL